MVLNGFGSISRIFENSAKDIKPSSFFVNGLSPDGFGSISRILTKYAKNIKPSGFLKWFVT
jgi:hypothetical protein